MAMPPEWYEELVFQARLRYLAFKRAVGLVETLYLLLAVTILLLAPQWMTPMVVALVAWQIMRVMREIEVHQRLATIFNASDT